MINCITHLFNLNSHHCTLYLTSISAIASFIFNIHQLFHMLPPDFFRSSTLTFTAPLSSLRQLIPATSFFFTTLCLAILNNSQPSQQKSIFSTAPQAFWSIATYSTLLVSFLVSQYFFQSSSFWLCFQILNNSLFLHTATSTSLFYHHISKYLGLPLVQPDFTCNSSLSQFQFLSELYFPPYFLLEHNIYQEKTMFTHYLFIGDYFHILDTTSILVIHKNITNYCFSFTRSKCYKSPFPFLETSIHQAQPFTNGPVQQSDPSIIYLLNPKTPHETLQNHPYHHQHGH